MTLEQLSQASLLFRILFALSLFGSFGLAIFAGFRNSAPTGALPFFDMVTSSYIMMDFFLSAISATALATSGFLVSRAGVIFFLNKEISQRTGNLRKSMFRVRIYLYRVSFILLLAVWLGAFFAFFFEDFLFVMQMKSIMYGVSALFSVSLLLLVMVADKEGNDNLAKLQKCLARLSFSRSDRFSGSIFLLCISFLLFMLFFYQIGVDKFASRLVSSGDTIISVEGQVLGVFLFPSKSGAIGHEQVAGGICHSEASIHLIPWSAIARVSFESLEKNVTYCR